MKQKKMSANNNNHPRRGERRRKLEALRDYVAGCALSDELRAHGVKDDASEVLDRLIQLARGVEKAKALPAPCRELSDKTSHAVIADDSLTGIREKLNDLATLHGWRHDGKGYTP